MGTAATGCPSRAVARAPRACGRPPRRVPLARTRGSTAHAERIVDRGARGRRASRLGCLTLARLARAADGRRRSRPCRRSWPSGGMSIESSDGLRHVPGPSVRAGPPARSALAASSSHDQQVREHGVAHRPVEREDAQAVVFGVRGDEEAGDQPAGQVARTTLAGVVTECSARQLPQGPSACAARSIWTASGWCS